MMNENTGNTIAFFFLCLIICFLAVTIRGCVEQQEINKFNLRKSAYENGYDIINENTVIKRHEKKENNKEDKKE